MSAGLRVVSPGFLTTVQDLGRSGHGEIGVPVAGAADPLALLLGNRLLGNEDGAPALEMTLVGAHLESERSLMIALAGSDFDAHVGNRRIPPWMPVELKPGDVVRTGASQGGARAYLCARGGLEVPLVLGSGSTHVLVGLGGFGGRPLRVGDRLETGSRCAGPPVAGGIDPRRLESLFRRGVLRVTWGPESGGFPVESLGALRSEVWRVSETSNRMGLRLEGKPLAPYGGRELLTEGVSPGTVQVPPDGRPIVLGVEHPTTGGYPRIASVISADLHRIGQLRPRDELRFEVVSLERALVLLQAREEALDALLR